MHFYSDHGVHFLNGLSDTAANVGESAELSCKLSCEDSNGLWYKDGKKVMMYRNVLYYPYLSTKCSVYNVIYCNIFKNVIIHVMAKQNFQKKSGVMAAGNSALPSHIHNIQ